VKTNGGLFFCYFLCFILGKFTHLHWSIVFDEMRHVRIELRLELGDALRELGVLCLELCDALLHHAIVVNDLGDILRHFDDGGNGRLVLLQRNETMRVLTENAAHVVKSQTEFAVDVYVFTQLRALLVPMVEVDEGRQNTSLGLSLVEIHARNRADLKTLLNEPLHGHLIIDPNCFANANDAKIRRNNWNVETGPIVLTKRKRLSSKESRRHV